MVPAAKPDTVVRAVVAPPVATASPDAADATAPPIMADAEGAAATSRDVSPAVGVTTQVAFPPAGRPENCKSKPVVDALNATMRGAVPVGWDGRCVACVVSRSVCHAAVPHKSPHTCRNVANKAAKHQNDPTEGRRHGERRRHCTVRSVPALGLPTHKRAANCTSEDHVVGNAERRPSRVDVGTEMGMCQVCRGS